MTMPLKMIIQDRFPFSYTINVDVVANIDAEVDELVSMV